MSEFSPLLRLHSEMSRLFEDFFEDAPATRPYGAAYPAVNLWEDGDAGYVEAELPGLSMNDIELLVLGNQLTINGQRKIADQPNASYHRRERSMGQFARTITMPWEIDSDKVEAKLHDGVLSVRLPKSEAAKPRKVKVLTT